MLLHCYGSLVQLISLVRQLGSVVVVGLLESYRKSPGLQVPQTSPCQFDLQHLVVDLRNSQEQSDNTATIG